MTSRFALTGAAEADAVAHRQLLRVERRLTRLEALRTELKRMIAQCSGGEIADCRIIEVLCDQSECLTEHKPADA